MSTSDRGILLYLYGLVPADAPDPPGELRGVEEGEVRLLRLEGVAAVLGEVPAAAYADAELDARLGDLGWVGERGVAHERVLDWFAERGPVLPLSLFSLHRDEERVATRLAGEQDRMRAVLEGLRGHREWGVKLWRREAEVAESVDQLSPTLRKLSAELAAAPPGKRFLLSKKREACRADEVTAVSKRLAHRVYGLLGSLAGRSTTIALPATPPAGERTLLLHAAFLVPDTRFDEFHRRVSEVAHEVAGSGFEAELTGPWPPYHFAELEVASDAPGG